MIRGYAIDMNRLDCDNGNAINDDKFKLQEKLI